MLLLSPCNRFSCSNRRDYTEPSHQKPDSPNFGTFPRQIVRAQLEDVAMHLLYGGLQLRYHAVKISLTLLRYGTVTPHVAWIEFRDRNFDEGEADMDRMRCRDVRLWRS